MNPPVYCTESQSDYAQWAAIIMRYHCRVCSPCREDNHSADVCVGQYRCAVDDCVRTCQCHHEVRP